MMFEINHDVPLPVQKCGRGARKYPFMELHVGDSFFVPIVRGGPRADRCLASLACRHGQKAGRVFTVRRVTEDGVFGARVWRLADKPEHQLRAVS